VTRLAPGLEFRAGRYRLERLVGAGGMATVWLGRDERLNRPVAVKVISDALAADPAFLARFTREARVASSLTHPNLVKVFDFDTEVDRPFLVMEYVDGDNLAERIAEGGPIPAPDVLADDLLNALAHIHEAGILHRDVKPANVLVGSDGRARLTDFGVAQPQDATQLTVTGNVVGTLKYIAPEVLEGESPTPLSDLYSCGVLLRDCATGERSPYLIKLLERLTAPNPARRPSSARVALELLHGVDIPAERPVREIHIEIERTKLIAALISLTALLVLILVLASGGDGAPPSRGEASPPARSGTPLERQLDALEREVRRASR
jgi:serine/threonine protein kinase